ncbi:MAG: AI-2E family transporter [Chloroflexi bacterium]|nr:AI-2E family transporter [Chloroflexota bacterium]
MDDVVFYRRALGVILLVGLFVGLVALVGQLISILLIVFTCWVLAVALDVPITFLEQRGVGRIPSIVIALTGVFLALALFVATLLPLVINQTLALAEQIPTAAERAVQLYENVREDTPIAEQVLPPFTLEDYQNLLSNLDEQELSLTPSAIDVTDVTDDVLGVLGRIGSFLGGVVGNLFLIIFITIFLVVDTNTYYSAILAITPSHFEVRALEVINAVRKTITDWLGAFLLSTVVTTILMWIMLGLIMGLPNSVALAVIAGLGTIVPTVGPAITLVPVVLVTLAAAPERIILVVILYAAIGATQDRVITPTIMKEQLNIPAAALLVFQLIAALFFGFFGLLLAVPLLAIVVTLIRELYVVDVLEKRGRIPQVEEAPDGTLYLLNPPQRPEITAAVEAESADLDDPAR